MLSVCKESTLCFQTSLQIVVADFGGATGKHSKSFGYQNVCKHKPRLGRSKEDNVWAQNSLALLSYFLNVLAIVVKSCSEYRLSKGSCLSKASFKYFLLVDLVSAEQQIKYTKFNTIGQASFWCCKHCFLIGKPIGLGSILNWVISEKGIIFHLMGRDLDSLISKKFILYLLTPCQVNVVFLRGGDERICPHMTSTQ